MGHGTKVGQGEAEVVTKKNLIVRLQAPRFFVAEGRGRPVGQRPQLSEDREAGERLAGTGRRHAGRHGRARRRQVEHPGRRRDSASTGASRSTDEGEAIVRMKAVTDEESDAMEMTLPRATSTACSRRSRFTGVIRPDKDSASVDVQRARPSGASNESRLEVRYSPTLAGAMVDALPYLVDYPYGCTEQTLNRFLPTVITQTHPASA